MNDANTQERDLYDPSFVAELFDRCSQNYRIWSAVCSFGFVGLWRRQWVSGLPPTAPKDAVIVDLMAGTGEIWPHILRRFQNLQTITAVDISHRMHLEAVEKLHGAYAGKINHMEANALEENLPEAYADMIVSSFGLKTFNKAQQTLLAQQIARMLKAGGSFSLIEASDPKGWRLRWLYRFYMDRALPQVEKFFLKGAQDFSMIGRYTQNFGDCSHFEAALQEAGLEVRLKKHFFGCATSVSGSKPE